MIRRALPLVVGLLAALAAVAWVERDHLHRAPPLARVERAAGGVRSADEPLAPGSPLDRGDRVTTDGTGRATIALPPHGRLELDPDSSVELLRLAPVELWLHKGALAVDAPVAVAYTRDATVALRGGRCSVALTATGTTVRAAASARVHVEGLHRTSTVVAPGQRLEIIRDSSDPAQPGPDPAPF
jgi:hypothetical protein